MKKTFIKKSLLVFGIFLAAIMLSKSSIAQDEAVDPIGGIEPAYGCRYTGLSTSSCYYGGYRITHCNFGSYTTCGF